MESLIHEYHQKIMGMTKKFLMLTVLFFALVSVAEAQWTLSMYNFGGIYNPDVEEPVSGNWASSDFYPPGFDQWRERLQLATGLRVRYALNDRFELQSGLLYNWWQADAKYFCPECSPIMPPIPVEDMDREFFMEDAKVRTQTVEIPMEIRINYLNKPRFALYSVAGGSFGVLVKREVFSHFAGDLIDPEQRFANHLIGAVRLGAEAEVKLNSTVSIGLEPGFNYRYGYYQQGFDLGAAFTASYRL